MIRLPTIALANPPSSLPGAGVGCVNMAMSSAEKPFLNKTNKIANSTLTPSNMAPMDSVSPTRLAHLRR